MNQPAPAPAPAPAPVEAKKEEAPAPAAEEKKEQPAPAPVEAKKEEPVPAPVVGKKEEPAPKVKTAAVSVPAASGDESTIHKGKVKWYNQQKGYGFIESAAGNGEDLFVHQTAIRKEGFRSLAKEEDVEFRVVKDEQGRTRAVDVTGPGGVEVIGAR